MKFRIPVLLVGLLCVAASVSAADRKTYHAGRCQYRGNTNYGLLHDSISGITAQETTYTVCPLTRDRMESATSLGSVEVEGYNTAAGGVAYECWLYAQTEDSTSGSYVNYDHFTYASVGRLSLPLDVDSTSGDPGGNEGTYGLYCHLPSGSKLYHIYMTESTASGSVN